MSKFPSKPTRGQPAIKQLYNSIIQIIDYLPTLSVVGDQRSTYVTKSSAGTVIHAAQPNSTHAKAKEYVAGSGITITSGNIINAKLSAGPNINIDYNSGWLVISGTPAASGSGGSDTNDTYIGDANYYNYLSGNHVFVSPDANYNGSHLVSSTLNWLQELNNNKFCESGRVTFPTTSHVIISDIGVNSDHCITPTDLIHDGLGTTVNYSWMRSPFGDEPTAMIGLVNGLQVDLTLSGGKYADVVLYQNKGGFGPVSHEVEPPTESTINVLLSGDGQIDPTTGHIFIRDIANDNGTSGGIIYTNLHAGNNVTIDPDGAINATGSGGGPDTNTEYIGDKNVDLSGHIWVNQTGSSPRLISSDLVHIDDLLNYPLSGDGNHFIQVNNLKDGAGTSLDFHWNSTGDSTEEGGQLIKFIDGVCVNLNVSGGQYVTTKFHQGVGYGDYTSASIDCNLSGDHQVYNSGLITIIPQYDSGYNITGGVISSILHAGSGLSIDYGTGEISLTGSVSPGPTPVGTFYAPDYAKFSTSQDVGHLIGLGTTFTLPVSKGSTLRFDSAVASATVGVWAPVEGSNSDAFLLSDSNSSGTPDDGYVRISVIDEGLISAGCLRLYVNDHDIPLHKFSKFNQGKVYDAGRYMQIQTTSTRINQQDQEQTYDLQNPLIHNMLTGGRFITIQQTEMINGTETQLRYPRINCDLTEGSNISISSAGIISVTGITNNIPTPVADTILSATAGGQMAWTPNTGGGGGPVTYVSGFYPNWGHGNHDSVVIPSNDSYSAPPFTMAQNGWIYAWASFNPSYDGFRYSSYRAHVIVGGAWFKVCELLLPFQKAELTLSSSSNIASQVPNGNYTRYPEGDVTNKFYLSGTYYDQQKEENVDFMVQCTRSEGNDQYETLYDGNDDQSGRNYTKFAWGVSNRPTENLPNVLFTDDQFITSNSYYDIYYKDQNDDFQPLYYLDGISNTMGKKSEDYTYFAWKNGNNDIVFSRRYGGMHQNIGAPTEYSISTLIYNYQNYIEYQETPLTSNRINFQNVYDNTEKNYWVKATASNVSDIAIGVGAAITIPARKGKNVQFKVETDNNGTYSVPISYGQQYGSGPFPVACVVYYDNPPEE